MEEKYYKLIEQQCNKCSHWDPKRKFPDCNIPKLLRSEGDMVYVGASIKNMLDQHGNCKYKKERK